MYPLLQKSKRLITTGHHCTPLSSLNTLNPHALFFLTYSLISFSHQFPIFPTGLFFQVSWWKLCIHILPFSYMLLCPDHPNFIDLITLTLDKECKKWRSFIHSIRMCRMWQFLAILRSFFHSFLLCTLSCHPSPPTMLPSSLTSSCHLFLGLPLNLVVPKFICNTLSGILFPSILCTCPNQHNLFKIIVSIIVGFLTPA